MISYTIKHIKTLVTEKVFKDGAVNVNINIGGDNPDFTVREILVEAHLNGSDSILALMMTVDALKRQFPRADLGLLMPYTMYARQDRVCNKGEALGIAVFGDLISNMGFKSIAIADPHSIATQVAIKGAQVIDQFDVFADIKSSWREWTIVAPDAGATKKCEDFAKRVGAKGVLTFNKVRDMGTVEITSLEPNQPIEVNAARKYMVLDDICDGGRTFVGVANAIVSHDKLANIELAVTHGIFSYGLDVVTDIYDHVYTTNSFRQDLVSDGKLTVIEM